MTLDRRLRGGVVVVTDRALAAGGGRSLVEVVSQAVDGGAVAVSVREKDLPAGERARLVGELRRVTARRGAALVVGSDPGLAAAVGADGVHLAAGDPWPADAARSRLRTASGAPGWVSRSCHTVEELRAARGRADWVTFSPVFPTASKPGYGPALGVAGLADGHRRVPDLPIVALGGIDATTARACTRAGAEAVAVMGAVMGADDVAGLTRRIAAEARAGGEDRARAGREDRAS